MLLLLTSLCVLYCLKRATTLLCAYACASMWDCESPTLYGYGPNASTNTPSLGFHGTGINSVLTVGETAALQGPGEGYAGTANSLANFCTNITETDDALKQVRGGGFLAEFERDDEEEMAAGFVEEIGGESCSTSDGISPLGETGKANSGDKRSHRGAGGTAGLDCVNNGNGTVSGLWVRSINHFSFSSKFKKTVNSKFYPSLMPL